MQNNSNIILATILSAIVLVGWTWFFEMPRIEKQQKLQKQQIQQTQLQQKIVSDLDNKEVISSNKTLSAPDQERFVAELELDRDEIIKKSQKLRISIDNDKLSGSINLVGAKFDDLLLKKYHKTIKNKKNVVLFSPIKTKERYFSDFGWISSDQNIDLPKPNTVWYSNQSSLTIDQPIELLWINKDNIEFVIQINLDENYLFHVKQLVRNKSDNDITLAPYGRVNRSMTDLKQANYILHEGPIGVFNGILEEVSYGSLKKDRNITLKSENGGWLGITDKYWISTIIPDQKISYNANFDYNFAKGRELFNVEYIGQEFLVKSGNEISFNSKLYAGAKEIKLLDQYSKDYNIILFDRAVDFGWFYFLTKPFFFMIQFFNKILGNFGLAILAMTIVIKMALFPMANKSYIAIARIKKLQPKIDEIRKKHKDDRMVMNREIMDMYKREKVNPASGCLPAIIQIPIFFALYKVLFVTIDMRHAPFFGWIKDLSASDPTSIFNLFGLLPFEVSVFFSLGAWPLIMGATMIIQQKLNPTVADPTQAKILKWMPYVFTIILATFPAGLVIYWAWSNLLSILQQWLIVKKFNKN